MAAQSTEHSTFTSLDVLIVGYGPVGQVLATLLAQAGRSVTVVERWPRPYTMPRAVSFDSESGRILAAAGVGDAISGVAEPSGEYRWCNATGETLLSIVADEHGVCGWPDSTSVYQPGLEAALAARGDSLPNLRVLRGHQVVGITDHGDHVEVSVLRADGERLAFRAGWVVGCDGANSFVRTALGTTVTDLGFSHDWLICDVTPHESRPFEPNNLQVCDPARPRTAVSAGPGHRRWEFMLVGGETVEEMDTVDSSWRLLSLFDVTPKNATLERHAVYRFEARWADQWRAGRILIAGDAAHVMPPFAGQGMCSGFRDAANLAWKLDMVQSGTADERLLDTYTTERRAHVQHAVGMSVNLGKVICQPDLKAAAERDTVMLAARQSGVGKEQPQMAVHPLRDGFLRRHAATGPPRPPVGQLMPQGPVARAGLVGLFDQVVGTGFVLLATEDPRRLLDEEALRYLDGIGGHLVHVAPNTAQQPADAVLDVSGVYLSFLKRMRSIAVLVRPDFYVFGAAADGSSVPGLVEDLRRGLAAAVPAI